MVEEVGFIEDWGGGGGVASGEGRKDFFLKGEGWNCVYTNIKKNIRNFKSYYNSLTLWINRKDRLNSIKVILCY